MERDNLLIVRTGLFMKPDAMNALRQNILEQVKDGVVLIPPYCEVIFAPGDLDVQIECEKEK